MSPQTPHAYEFDRFRLDASERLLLRDGQVVPLTPKVFDTLLALVERSGHVVGKEELMRRLWPDSFVEESSLSQNIFLLRRALGEAASGRQYIETLPRRGYRFVADLREVRGTDSEEVLREQAGTQILTGEESPQAPDAQAIQDADAAADAGDASPPAPPPSGGRRLKLYASLACAVLLAIAVPAYLSR
ncbi:MAG TPA: transcriptional regulator, partial [Pyrinomonadaceae bacterium]|nr:transcriptional regulator [Pyrinomonadaceae bacterium]